MSSWVKVTTVGFMDESDVVFRFTPKLYDENLDMQAVYTAQHIEAKKLFDALLSAYRDNFIVTASVGGIRRYEEILGIVPDERLDDLETRRKRVINKLAMNTPYTRLFLEQYLETVFGAGNWSLNIDDVNLILYIDIETESIQIYNQAVRDIGQIIPANLDYRPTGDVPFTHRYLGNRFTHEQMTQFTYGELSQYA